MKNHSSNLKRYRYIISNKIFANIDFINILCLIYLYFYHNMTTIQTHLWVRYDSNGYMQVHRWDQAPSNDELTWYGSIEFNKRTIEILRWGNAYEFTELSNDQWFKTFVQLLLNYLFDNSWNYPERDGRVDFTVDSSLEKIARDIKMIQANSHENIQFFKRLAALDEDQINAFLQNQNNNDDINDYLFKEFILKLRKIQNPEWISWQMQSPIEWSSVNDFNGYYERCRLVSDYLTQKLQELDWIFSPEEGNLLKELLTQLAKKHDDAIQEAEQRKGCESLLVEWAIPKYVVHSIRLFQEAYSFEKRALPIRVEILRKLGFLGLDSDIITPENALKRITNFG